MTKKTSIFLLILILFSNSVNPSCALEALARIKDSIVSLEIADSIEEKSKGLMDRTSLDKNKGMVFIFRPPQRVTFWMKDTLISLDMIFINKGQIVNIVKNAKPNQIDILYPSEAEVTEVVEVNAGFTDEHKINIGDKITFENIPQIDYSTKPKLMILSK